MRKYGVLLYLLSVFWSGVSQAQVNLLSRSLVNVPDSVKALTLCEIGDSLINSGQFVLAKQAYQQALTVAQTGADQQAIGLGYRGIGYWYESTGDYVQAISWYQKALNSFRQGINQKQFARTLSFIGFAYGRLHEDKQALDYINQCKLLAEKNGYQDLLIDSYEQLAIYQSNHKQYQTALAYRQKVLAYYKAKNDWSSYYGALYNVGLLYKNMGQYKRSEQAFRQVLAYAEKHKEAYEYMAGYVFVSMPYALIPQNKLDEAEAYCRRALAWVEKTGTEKHALLEEINSHQSLIAEQRGDFKQALLYYKKQIANHDSVFNKTKSQQVADLEARYETHAKEEHIQHLNETNARQTQQIWIGVVVVFLLVSLLGALYLLYTRVSRSRWKIQQQSDQLTLMMKELHHRAKNNLSIVSSLLFLQANYSEDSHMMEEIRVSQQRVEAMSLIHQRLYQDNQTTSVNMGEYLTDLAESLLKAYGHPITEFDLQLAIDLVEMDVDIAIPMGLIVNELLTNSFKYAFNTEKPPMLRIALHEIDAAEQKGILLEVQDNGPGVDLTDWQKVASRKSFGKKLISLLCEQLGGKFDLIKQNGTLFKLYVPHHSKSRLRA